MFLFIIEFQKERKKEKKYMLRRSLVPLQRHTAVAPHFSKMTNRPGKWGTQGGPPADTFSRRLEFFRIITLNRIGKMMQPFKSPRAIWFYRKAQARLWKTAVGVLIASALFVGGNMWMMLAYNAYSVPVATPVLQRKAREHRVSKQIVTMVRERETELYEEQAAAEAAKIAAAAVAVK